MQFTALLHALSNNAASGQQGSSQAQASASQPLLPASSEPHAPRAQRRRTRSASGSSLSGGSGTSSSARTRSTWENKQQMGEEHEREGSSCEQGRHAWAPMQAARGPPPSQPCVGVCSKASSARPPAAGLPCMTRRPPAAPRSSTAQQRSTHLARQEFNVRRNVGQAALQVPAALRLLLPLPRLAALLPPGRLLSCEPAAGGGVIARLLLLLAVLRGRALLLSRGGGGGSGGAARCSCGLRRAARSWFGRGSRAGRRLDLRLRPRRRRALARHVQLGGPG